MTGAVGSFFAAGCILAFYAFASLRRKHPSAILFGALALYAFVGASSASSFTTAYGIVAFESAAFIYCLSSLLLVGGVALARRFWTPLVGNGQVEGWTEVDHHRFATIGAVTVVAGFVMLVLDRGDLLINWSEARRTAGPLSALSTFFLLVGIPSIASALRSRRWTLVVLTALLGGASVELSGSRALAMSALMLIMWLLITRVRQPSLQALAMSVGLPLAFLVHVVLRFLRGVGPANILQMAQTHTLGASISSYLSGGADSSGGEFAIAKYFVYATTVEDTQEFGFLTTVKRIFLMPLPPSGGLLEKPQDVTYRLWVSALRNGVFSDAQGADFLRQGYREGIVGSLHSTLFGELFVSGGWLSLIPSLVVVVLAITLIDAFMSRTSSLERLMLMGAVLAGYLFVARGNTVIGLGFFVYPLALMRIMRVALSFLRTRAPVSSRRAI